MVMINTREQRRLALEKDYLRRVHAQLKERLDRFDERMASLEKMVEGLGIMFQATTEALQRLGLFEAADAAVKLSGAAMCSHCAHSEAAHRVIGTVAPGTPPGFACGGRVQHPDGHVASCTCLGFVPGLVPGKVPA